ncbi:unnamed protein product [Caenorhabditis auriculariae]|uniref:Serpentine receptor class gamma n=1 Tax=Caenorhabditis auriculariae TaxID=2777116 RepID=A0A8S1HNJ2_9PELO|nr:unnamed protein product [Caenorhabditis auriculariae]
MDLFNARFTIQAAYGIPSVILYFITVVFLFKNWKQFDTYFFRLYIAQFITNIWTYGNSFITLRLPQNTCQNCYLSEFFLSHSKNQTEDVILPLDVFYTLHFQFAFIQYSIITINCVNRFTMIFFPSEYQKIWQLATWPALFLSIFPWFYLTEEILFSKCYYEYVPTMDCYATKTSYAINRFYITDVHKTSFWSQYGALFISFGSDALTHSSPWVLIVFSSKARMCLLELFGFRKKKMIFTSIRSKASTEFFGAEVKFHSLEVVLKSLEIGSLVLEVTRSTPGQELQ